VLRAKAVSKRDVLFTFDAAGNRELPLIVGQLYVLPRHWWLRGDGSSTGRDVAATTLEPTLGSGPYRLARVEPGQTAIYQRVEGYWARGLNTQIGCNNFDELRFEYFRDSTAAFEAFKAGDEPPLLPIVSAMKKPISTFLPLPDMHTRVRDQDVELPAGHLTPRPATPRLVYPAGTPNLFD
jgi:ABC-type transport system substrate-binding protein